MLRHGEDERRLIISQRRSEILWAFAPEKMNGKLLTLIPERKMEECVYTLLY